MMEINDHVIDKTIETVAKFYNVSTEDIISKSRLEPIIKPRFITVYILREKFRGSFPAIANKIGGREHTTAIHAYKKIREAIQKDPLLRNEINDICAIIEGQKEYIERDTDRVIKKALIKKERKIKKINPVLSDRDKKILVAWQFGRTLEDIGQEFNITRERVRQIVKKTISKEIVNKQLEGFEIDTNEFLKQEKSSHIYLRKSKSTTHGTSPVLSDRDKKILVAWQFGRTLENIGKEFSVSAERVRQIVDKTISREASGKRLKRWSRYYDHCRKCGTTVVPHHVSGFCDECSPGVRNKRRVNLILKAGNKCGLCGLSQVESFRKLGRDLYVVRIGDYPKNYIVMCRKCFLGHTAKKMVERRKNLRKNRKNN